MQVTGDVVRSENRVQAKRRKVDKGSAHTVVDIPKHRCKIWCDAERLGQTCIHSIHSNTFSSLAIVRGFFILVRKHIRHVRSAVNRMV